jgi:hypothetical protein
MARRCELGRDRGVVDAEHPDVRDSDGPASSGRRMSLPGVGTFRTTLSVDGGIVIQLDHAVGFSFDQRLLNGELGGKRVLTRIGGPLHDPACEPALA